MSMSSNGAPSRRSLSLSNISGSMRRASESGGGGVDSGRKSLTGSRSMGLTGERTVRRLRLSRALTMPETTSIREACRKMAARKVDALLLTDSNALLSGILTDKDITMKVIAQELHLDETPVSKVMTRNPTFVLSDTLAVEALQKMVQGRFRHLPVVENGEVIALLDIAKCLHDAIARMERAAEKGKAIAAAVEGVEKNWGTSLTVPNAFIETIRERMFRPSLSTIVENSKVVTISPEETVLVAAKKMLEFQSSSAVVAVNNKPQGILTTRDLLMRVVAQDLPIGSTTVDKVMTRDPECATVDTPVVDALNIMYNGKFLHLPVVDRERNIVAVVDVLHVTHAAVATVGTAVGGESASATMQKFWDSAMALSTAGDDDDNRSESSFRFPSEVVERSPSYPSPSPSSLPNLFSFKIQDKHGRMHRFTCNTRTLTDVIACIIQRVGGNIDRNNLPQIMYEDEDGDRVVLASDSDLTAALEHARLAGWKGLRLHLDYSKRSRRRRVNTSVAQSDAWAAAYSTVAAGAALAAGYGIFVYLKRNGHLPS